MRGNIKEKKMGPLKHRWGSKATRDAAAEGGQPGLQGPQSPFRGQGSVDTDTEMRDILACSGLKSSSPIPWPRMRILTEGSRIFFVFFLSKASDLHLPLQALSVRACVCVCVCVEGRLGLERPLA